MFAPKQWKEYLNTTVIIILVSTIMVTIFAVSGFDASATNDPLGLTSEQKQKATEIGNEIMKLKTELTDKEQQVYNLQQEIDMTGGEIQRLKGEWQSVTNVPYDKEVFQ